MSISVVESFRGLRCVAWMTILGLVVVLPLGKIAAADHLPALDEPGFKALCEEMYAERDSDAGWPLWPRGDARHCTVSVAQSSPTEMSGDDYAWALGKSLTFACKGKREVIYEVVRRLRHCDGGERSMAMTPAEMPGGCRVRFRETDEAFTVQPPLIDDLIAWRDGMPWYERVLVDLFAPRELPMVMDGLIDCGGRT